MREFLKGLELDEETIDTIMAEVGKGYTKLKEQVDELKEQNNQYQDQIKELNGTIEENNKSLESLQTLTDENKDLKAEIQMNGSQVKKEFSKFVRNEVMENVNDDTDFATALESYKKENPQYFGDPVVKKVQTSPKLTNNSGGESTNSIMNDVIRQAVNNK